LLFFLLLLFFLYLVAYVWYVMIHHHHSTLLKSEIVGKSGEYCQWRSHHRLPAPHRQSTWHHGLPVGRCLSSVWQKSAGDSWMQEVSLCCEGLRLWEHSPNKRRPSSTPEACHVSDQFHLEPGHDAYACLTTRDARSCLGGLSQLYKMCVADNTVLCVDAIPCECVMFKTFSELALNTKSLTFRE